MMKFVCYTAIFGKKDILQDPLVIIPNCDYICFTDEDCANYSGNVWNIKKVIPINDQNPRLSAKIFKILPHKYFSNYPISVWVDGNQICKKDFTEIIEKYLIQENYEFAVFNNHSKVFNVFEEIEFHINKKRAPEELLKKQIERYVKEGFPDNLNNVIFPAIMFRKHNCKDLINLNELWWKEICNETLRDMISFPYVQWKTNYDKFIRIPFFYKEFFKRNVHLIRNYGEGGGKVLKNNFGNSDINTDNSNKNKNKNKNKVITYKQTNKNNKYLLKIKNYTTKQKQINKNTDILKNNN